MELQGAGVRHVLKVGGDNRVLATFPDHQPAIVQVPIEKGQHLLLGYPAGARQHGRADGRCAGRLWRAGPIRFLTPDGKHVSGLEYRAIKTSDGWLAYVNNLDRKQRPTGQARPPTQAQRHTKPDAGDRSGATFYSSSRRDLYFETNNPISVARSL